MKQLSNEEVEALRKSNERFMLEEAARRRRRTTWTVAIAFVAVPAFVVFFLVLDAQTEKGRGSQGEQLVARVNRLDDGSCPVGEKRSHCYLFSFTVFPPESPSFDTQLNVVVPDRFASRIQPGNYVRVVRDPEDRNKVLLNVEAFSEPPPPAPSAS